MRLATILLLVALSASCVNAEPFRWLPWEQDRFNSTNGLVLKYDKLEHALLFGGLTLLPKEHGRKYAFALGLGNEIKDALVPYEKYGRIGGEGFSWKDLFANVVGIVAVHYGRQSLDRLF